MFTLEKKKKNPKKNLEKCPNDDKYLQKKKKFEISTAINIKINLRKNSEDISVREVFAGVKV